MSDDLKINALENFEDDALYENEGAAGLDESDLEGSDWGHEELAYEDDEFLPALGALAPMIGKVLPMAMSIFQGLAKEEEELEEEDLYFDDELGVPFAGLGRPDAALAEALASEAAHAKRKSDVAALAAAAAVKALGSSPAAKYGPVIAKAAGRTAVAMARSKSTRALIKAVAVDAAKRTARTIAKMAGKRPISNKMAVQIYSAHAQEQIKAHGRRIRRKRLSRGAIVGSEREY